MSKTAIILETTRLTEDLLTELLIKGTNYSKIKILNNCYGS